MDIDPIIGKQRLAIYDKDDSKIVSIAEALRGADDRIGRRRIKCLNQLAQRHRRNKVIAIIIYSLAARRSCGYMIDSPPTVRDPLDLHAPRCNGIVLG